MEIGSAGPRRPQLMRTSLGGAVIVPGRKAFVSLPARLEAVDVWITAWLGQHGVTLSRLSLGAVFLWFGALKLVPGWSPAADLASRTIQRVTFGLVPPEWGLLILGAWETLIGLGLLTGKFLRITLLLLAVQMVGTVLPLLLFRAETFVLFPLAPTLEGQYIIKNLVLVSAAAVVGATVRGIGLAPEKEPLSGQGHG
jgi:uncharacterized membrane protein YphA (DoxX/SURF4 family)